MSDALTILRAAHPDLRWRGEGASERRFYAGMTRHRRVCVLPEGEIVVLARDEARASMKIDIWDTTHEANYPGASVAMLAAELVDLRRAIGWPVGVSRG